MYVHLMVAIPDNPDAEKPKKDPHTKRAKVDLSGNVQAASQLEGGMRKRGWRYDVVVLGPVQRPKVDVPDLVVNCICDPTFHQVSLELVAELVTRFKFPVLNPPWAVIGASRVLGSRRLSHQLGVTMPRTTEYDTASGTLAEHLKRHGQTVPVLGRPLGAHGGKGLVRIDKAKDIPDELADLKTFLITDFADYVSADGLYRKYRVVYVNDRIFRRHVVISDSWKIAGESRLVMDVRPELVEEEKAFIAAKGGDFEDRLIHQFRALGLDFGVCDFNIGDDGTVTIFEINPCFQLTASIPEGKQEKWGYLEDNNDEIVEAILDTMAERTGKAV